MLAARGARVVLRVQPPLVRLLQRLPGPVAVLGRGEALPAYGLHCPMLSLPHCFGTTLETVPAEIPYLRVDPAKAEWWRARLADSGRGCASAWSGPGRRGRACRRRMPWTHGGRCRPRRWRRWPGSPACGSCRCRRISRRRPASIWRIRCRTALISTTGRRGGGARSGDRGGYLEWRIWPAVWGGRCGCCRATICAGAGCTGGATARGTGAAAVPAARAGRMGAGAARTGRGFAGAGGRWIKAGRSELRHQVGQGGEQDETPAASRPTPARRKRTPASRADFRFSPSLRPAGCRRNP